MSSKEYEQTVLSDFKNKLKVGRIEEIINSTKSNLEKVGVKPYVRVSDIEIIAPGLLYENFYYDITGRIYLNYSLFSNKNENLLSTVAHEFTHKYLSERNLTLEELCILNKIRDSLIEKQSTEEKVSLAIKENQFVLVPLFPFGEEGIEKFFNDASETEKYYLAKMVEAYTGSSSLNVNLNDCKEKKVIDSFSERLKRHRITAGNYTEGAAHLVELWASGFNMKNTGRVRTKLSEKVYYSLGWGRSIEIADNITNIVLAPYIEALNEGKSVESAIAYAVESFDKSLEKQLQKVYK